MGKKKAYTPKPFEANRGRDSSANIYKSMLESDAFKDLSARQKILYVYAKSRRYGQTTKQKEELFSQFPGIQMPVDVEEYFSMTRGNAVYDWGLYSRYHVELFYRDVEELILHGFIKCVACGAVGKKKSIYKYSDKWRLWGMDGFEITRDEMTTAMQKKRSGKTDS